jgi:putative hydrolase of the HAD superfamily
MLKAVLFDLGGTLLHYESATADIFDLNRQGFAGLYRYLSANGQVALSEGTFVMAVNARATAAWQTALASFRGGSVETSVKATLADLGLSLTDAEWQAARQAFYEPIRQSIVARKGAQYTLRALRDQGVVLGILSNTFWAADVHDADLSRFGLLEFLPTRLYSCDIGRLKPHPESFKMALTALGVEPHEAIYVGDRLKTDVEPARQVGLWGVLIRVPFRDEESEETMPDAIIDELPELIRLLERQR